MSRPQPTPSTRAPGAPAARTADTLGAVRMTLVIARREMDTRIRQKSFHITTIVLMLLAVAGALIPSFVGDADPLAVGVPAASWGSASTPTGPSIESAAQVLGVDVEVSEVGSREAGEANVKDGTLDVLVVPAKDAAGFSAVVNESLPSDLQQVFAGLAQQGALTAQITGLGGDPAIVSAAVAGAHVDVVTLTAAGEQDTSQLVVACIAGVVMFCALMFGAQFVAQGVVEEKTSRVVEVLLAAVKPSHLMAGKVLGIGAVTLLQMGLIVGVAAAASSQTGLLDGAQIQLGSVLAWALVWFLVGYATFALLLAGLASLVSRQEEVGSVVSPGISLAMVPYMFGIAVLIPDPANAAGRVMSFIPFFAPFLMPIRHALGVAPTWEIVVALTVSLAFLPVLAWLAGRVYSRAVLNTGARMKLADALRKT